MYGLSIRKAHKKVLEKGVIMAKKSKKEIKSDLEKEDQAVESMLADTGWMDTLNEKNLREMQTAAKAHVERQKKEARVNLRLEDADVERFRQMAKREGMGYQTLMVSILHKYAQGNLVDKIMLEQLAYSIRKTY